MHTFRIFYENADTDEPRVYLGDVEALTPSEALKQASQYYEIPSHDLVVVQVTREQQDEQI